MPPLEESSIEELLTTLYLALRLLLRPAEVEEIDAQFVECLERELHALMRWAADSLFAIWLRRMLSGSELQTRAIAARRASCAHGWRHKGHRGVKLELLGGHHFKLKVAYGAPGRPTAHKRTKRGKDQGHQRTPVLEVLGFVDHQSPALAAELLESSSACESLQAARQQLHTRGIVRTSAQLQRTTHRAAWMLREHLERWMQQPRQEGPLSQAGLAGRRVVLTFDGGRLRERLAHRGRKKANGYRNFSTSWVEPRLFVAYCIDEQGRMDKGFERITHASLAGPDELFAQLHGMLSTLQLEQADEVIVCADGQHWQWKRIETMLERLGVESSRIHLVLDMGHALAHLHKVAEIRSGYGKERKAWEKEGRKLLKAGRIEELLEHGKLLARGPRAPAITTAMKYFEKHKHRMDYPALRAAHRPTGSGVVESMIRQVINMRLKGCGKFWLREHAQNMLMLRAWLKSRRLSDLYRYAHTQRVHWWYKHAETPEDSQHALAS